MVGVAGLAGRPPGQPHAAAALLPQQRPQRRRLALPVHHAPPARPATVVDTMLSGGIENESVFTFALVAAMRVDAAPVVTWVRLFLALVYVAADLLVRLVPRARRTHAREAARRVAALPARAVRLMHITFIDIPADAISVGMEARVTDALVPRLQVLAGAVRTDAGDHGALVDVGTSVVFAGAFGAEDVVLLASTFRTRFASHTPA